jgi:hypothetical protein
MRRTGLSFLAWQLPGQEIMKILENALSRAADAAEALEGVTQECSGLGFSGDQCT